MLLLLSGAVAVIKTGDMPQSGIVTVEQMDWSRCWVYARQFLDWFCGLNTSTSSTSKQTRRLRDSTSLQQTRSARATLYTALTFLITLDLFLYVFFSSGSDFGLLRNSHLAPVVLFDNMTAAVQNYSRGA